MGKFFGYFWIVFILYFIFAHPAIIYYNTTSYDHLELVDGKKALVYLGLSIFLWTSVFCIAFYMIYKYSFQAQKNIASILKSGKRIQAKIIESKSIPLKTKNFIHKKVILELDNFNQQKIWHSMEINDSRPNENRFEEGNWISILVDESFSKMPYIILDGIKSKVNYKLYFIWFIALLGIIYYYAFSYQLENHGFGWRFLSFDHPLIISPLVIFFICFIFWLVFVKLMGKNSFRNKESLELKFKGEKTFAKILSAEQTGTYINNQPQVKFELEYTDSLGKKQHATIKKIVLLTDLVNIHQKEKEIFYSTNNHQNVAFTDDLNEI